MIFWISLFLILGATVFHYSRAQPFPEKSGKFAFLLITTGLIMIISISAPRPTEDLVAPVVATIIGGLAVIIGTIHMSILRDDVIIAPFGGFLLCIGAIDLLSSQWVGAGQIEQIGSFAFASILVLLEIYLAFKGLVVGIQGISWSKSGLRQIHRGILLGDSGAITHFEKSWDMENQWINAMSHSALSLIYRHLNDENMEKKHTIELEQLGGWQSVDESWIITIENALELL
ncbi:MAG: hypothetical protein CXT72_01085 [Methanobacteriota archaeon]|jgi:hypothetical protein|nr:MAG: hypothetical protein CXT72_01085 [Euryarchaeota archaeon]HIE63310.1 hypothetical protein [Candidatus Poseidoniales archaeon]HIL00164.1 hypothetical protein [Candidatus Poseidoniales archaeon]